MTRIQPDQQSAPQKKRVKKTPRKRPTTEAQRVKRMNKITGVDKITPPPYLKTSDRFWEVRSTFGRKPIFSSPDELMKACLEYFNWVEAHPLYEYKPMGLYQGQPVVETIPKKRPFTLGSLHIFLDISQPAWLDYRTKSPDFSIVCGVVEQAIREQKFAGAAAGFFNHAIIARDLGLVDRQDVTSGGEKLQNQSVVVLPSKEEIPA
jgi:hypothetical protein